MGACQRCGPDGDLVVVNAKCSDMFTAVSEAGEFEGYVPEELGIGSGDNLGFTYCLNCGQLQGAWERPLPKSIFARV